MQRIWCTATKPISNKIWSFYGNGRPNQSLRPASKNTAPLIQGMVKKDVAIATHTSLHGLTSEKEEAIRRLYDRLDMDNDGVIDVREIKNYCDDLGVPISDAKITKVIGQMDRSGSDSIDLGEFQHFMHNLVIDIGEDSQIPEDFTETEILQGIWWRHLVAGGWLAVCPGLALHHLIDSKFFLQVHSNKTTPFNMFSGVTICTKRVD
uniref:EF-hand domain-containing protein n=1 Tax=Ditylenchus dipsaci TaxID=166011 RepID=A0A915ECE9_9BILA